MLELFEEIANKVETEIKKYIYSKQVNVGKTIEMGADGTPTTFIDKIAEELVIKMVMEYDKKLNILSEEIGLISNGGEDTVILDPIDGTFNAVHGIPFYSISIALGHKKLSDMKCGLVKNIATGEMFTAEHGNGAFRNNEPIETRDKSNKPNISIYFGDKVPENVLKIVRQTHHVRFFGCASLELCLVASGVMDMYHHVGYPLRITDIAAGALILREAGGEIFTEHKKILDMKYNLDTRVNIIAIGDRKMMELIQ